MLRVVGILITFHLSLFTSSAQDSRTFNQIDESGNITQRTDNRNFNKNSNDTTKNKKRYPKDTIPGRLTGSLATSSQPPLTPYTIYS